MIYKCKPTLHFLSFLFITLLFTLLVNGQTVVKFQDYASKGGSSAIVQGTSSTNKFPQVFPSCTVTVYQAGTVTLATIYSDSSLSAKSNPFTATSEGYYEFYIVPGNYDIRFSGTGIATPFTRSNIEINVGSANIFGGTVDYLQLKSSSSALGDSPLYKSGGVVHGITAGSSTNTTQLATTAYTRYQRGKLRVIATASLPTTTYTDGAAVEDGDKVQLSDGNRATVTYRTGMGWIKDWTEFNVMSFSVDNTGATNTQAAIQTAIDAAAAAGVLDVYVPAGTYKLTRATDGTNNYGLKITNNIRLRGDGVATVFVGDSSAATRFIPILIQPGSTVNYVEFRDFVINGSNKGQLDAGLMQINNAVRIVLDGLEIKNGGTAAEASPAGVNGVAISSTSSGTTQQITLGNLYIHDTTKAAINISTNAQNVQINNPRVKNITGNGQAPGIQVNGSNVVKINGAIVNATEGPGIVISTVGTPPSHTDSSEVTIANSFISGAGTGSSVGDGIKLQNTNGASGLMYSKVNIVNSHIYSNGVVAQGAGIRIEYQRGVSVKNCFIYDNSANGITAQSSQELSLQNNDIFSNNTANLSGGAGIYLYGASGAFVISQALITGNRFYNSGNQKYPVALDNNTGGNFTYLTITDNTSYGHVTSDGMGVIAGGTANSLTDVYRTSFTDGRVPYRASGRWTDSANLKFDGTNLDVTGTGQTLRAGANGSYVYINAYNSSLSGFQPLFSYASGFSWGISGTDKIGLSSTSLYNATAGDVSLGNSTNPWKYLHFSGDSSSAGSNNFKLTGTATGARTVTLQDQSGTVALRLSGSGSLDYATASANTCETLTLTVTGAVDGDAVSLGVPHALSNHNTFATFFAWVSASNTVSVRRCVIEADGSDPAAATVTAKIVQ